jgi:hypothetical protein
VKSAWLLLVAACVLTASSMAQLQVLNPPARDILNTARVLQPGEIAIVLAAVREAVSGKTLRLSYVPNGPGPEVLMGTNGRPRFVRAVSGYELGGDVVFNGIGSRTPSQQNGHVDVVTFTEYTSRSARKCDGTSLNDELVIEYEHKSTNKHWTVKARTRTLVEALSPAFDILTGNAAVESGNRRSFEDRVGRALVAPWKLPDAAQSGGPLPAGARQSLWIDIVSMLPLRWSISVPAMPEHGSPAIPDFGLSFTYDSSLDLRPPDVTLSSDCVL